MPALRRRRPGGRSVRAPPNLTVRQIALYHAAMQLGDVVGGEEGGDRPLDGVRVLAAEQMQALPYGTQLLARLGADVVKVEHPTTGESGRGSYPWVLDPEGRRVGATFLRNNLGKRSVA